MDERNYPVIDEFAAEEAETEEETEDLTAQTEDAWNDLLVFAAQLERQACRYENPGKIVVKAVDDGSEQVVDLDSPTAPDQLTRFVDPRFPFTAQTVERLRIYGRSRQHGLGKFDKREFLLRFGACEDVDLDSF